MGIINDVVNLLDRLDWHSEAHGRETTAVAGELAEGGLRYRGQLSQDRSLEHPLYIPGGEALHQLVL